MANVSSYTFDNMSRLGNDSCCIDQTTIQNVASCNYMTQNFFAADCSMKNPISLSRLRNRVLCTTVDITLVPEGATLMSHPSSKLEPFKLTPDAILICFNARSPLFRI